MNMLLLMLQAGTPSVEAPVYSYLPIVLFLIVAAAFPGVALLVLRVIRPKVYHPKKMMPYECGIDPIKDARDRFSVRFYIIAMLFLIFDVETVFLLPWAIVFDQLLRGTGLLGLGLHRLTTVAPATRPMRSVGARPASLANCAAGEQAGPPFVAFVHSSQGV